MRSRRPVDVGLRTTVLLGGAALVSVATLLSVAARGTVEAAALAAAERTVGVGVATWRAAASSPGGAHLGMAYAPDWTTQGGDAVAVLDVVNVGELALATQTIVVRDADGDAPTGPVEVVACDGGLWNGDGTSCPGTVVVLGDAADGPVVTGVALAPDGRLSVRLSARRNVVARGNLVVDVAVSRAAVRGPVVTSG